MTYQIRATHSFLRATKRLARKYRRLKKDLQTLQETLTEDPHRGIAIPGLPIVFGRFVWPAATYKAANEVAIESFMQLTKTNSNVIFFSSI